MRFDPPLVQGTFLRRYKRFFLDAVLDSGEEVTAHCPNTGSLKGCLEEGAKVLLEPASNPARKLRWTWKMVRLDRSWVGVDTGVANPLVHEAIEAGAIPELSGYDRILTEVKYGKDGRSRIDLLLSKGGTPATKGKGKARVLYEGDERVYVEVKNTTLVEDRDDGRVAAFPDAVTERGRKHLHELMDVVAQGHRAAMVYSIQRDDCRAFVPAVDIDPAYCETLAEAVAAGVEAYALGANITPEGVELTRRLPVELP